MAKRSLEETVRAERKQDEAEAQHDREPTSGSPAEQMPPIHLQRARKPMPKTDPELQAMARIDRLLAELDGNQQRRVVEWIRDRFGPQCRFGPFEGGTPNDHDTAKESTR